MLQSYMVKRYKGKKIYVITFQYIYRQRNEGERGSKCFGGEGVIYTLKVE